ncbi:MAG TPA: universal stress protein [Trebonia sp.]|nr:universal stress protein [Trebonia sp.]
MPGIIVGIDGSERARHALEWAVKEAAIRQTPLTVLTVQQAVEGTWGAPAPVSGRWGGPVGYAADSTLAQHVQETAQQETDAILEKAESRPPSVSVQAVTGLPAEELLKAAGDADLIVVGSRGAGGFRRLLMGSVCAQVTHHAACPVVVVPAQAG